VSTTTTTSTRPATEAVVVELPGIGAPESLVVRRRELPAPGPGRAVVRMEATGGTIVVLGAAGGVGSVLLQLARRAGIRVIGVAGAPQRAVVEALGATFVDRRGEDVPARVAELAPGGVDAVFDHVGGPGIVASWRMLARGGTLVSYGTAATRDVPGDPRLPVLALVARLAAWNVLPNGRRATFFDVWAGRRRTARFRAGLRRDLGHLFALLRDGDLDAQVAGRFALTEAPAALRFAEAGGRAGKVVLVAGDAGRAADGA
jgi:NADPH2:quinone reductase